MRNITLNATASTGEDITVMVTEAGWDIMLSAMEIGIEGAADGANGAHVDDADHCAMQLREFLGDPTKQYILSNDGGMVVEDDMLVRR